MVRIDQTLMSVAKPKITMTFKRSTIDIIIKKNLCALRVTTQRVHLQISDRVRDDVAFHNENSVSGELREVHFAVMLYILVSALVHTRIVKANLSFDRDGEKSKAWHA
jgi:hypothetical protein